MVVSKSKGRNVDDLGFEGDSVEESMGRRVDDRGIYMWVC